MGRTLRADDFGFEVEILVNATSSAALQALDQWISKADYDDLVLIYFSGHGKLSRARELFLTCANTNSKNLISTALKYAQLTELIRESSLQKVAIILDCCYAGRAIEGGRGDPRGAVEQQVCAAVEASPGSGIFFLGASGKNQTAEEREIDGHGRFTKHIIEGLSSGDADIDNDGNISAKDLATYVKQRLRSASQEPIEGGAYQGELILGGNRRTQLTAFVSTIRASLQNNRDEYFSRETFRRIEDYLDQIMDGTDVRSVVEDSKYLILKRYSAKKANLEEVAKAFWSPPVRADLPAQQVAKAEESLPSGTVDALERSGIAQAIGRGSSSDTPSELNSKGQSKRNLWRAIRNKSAVRAVGALVAQLSPLLLLGLVNHFRLKPLFLFSDLYLPMLLCLLCDIMGGLAVAIAVAIDSHIHHNKLSSVFFYTVFWSAAALIFVYLVSNDANPVFLAIASGAGGLAVLGLAVLGSEIAMPMANRDVTTSSVKNSQVVDLESESGDVK
jgi:hypothetical protein